MNFNHQLNVANILLQLDDEDIDVIQSELTDEELDELNPALQVKYQSLWKGVDALNSLFHGFSHSRCVCYGIPYLHYSFPLESDASPLSGHLRWGEICVM